MWVRNRIKVADRFGQVVGHLRDFFKNAKVNVRNKILRVFFRLIAYNLKLPEPKLPPLKGENPTPAVPASFEIPEKRKLGSFNFSTSQASSSSLAATYGDASAQAATKTAPNEIKYIVKKRKLTVVPSQTAEAVTDEDSKAYIIMVLITVLVTYFVYFT